MEVNGVHGGSDYVGLAVTRGHDAGHLVHELHGDTCTEKGHVAGQTRRGYFPPWKPVLRDKALPLPAVETTTSTGYGVRDRGIAEAHAENLASLGVSENDHS